MPWRRVIRVVSGLVLALVVIVAVWIGVAMIVYPNDYVVRVLAWRESDAGDYLHNFEHSPLAASEDPFMFEPAADEEQERARSTLEAAFVTEELEPFLAETDTQALLVVQGDQLVYEGYFGEWNRDSLLTSFSVAKSFVSTLIGIAIEEGHIGGLDDLVTDYLP